MPMRFEIPAVDFQLDKHQLPLSRRYLNVNFVLDTKANKW
jgi:hypothetical protein